MEENATTTIVKPLELVIDQTPGSIKTNFEDVKKALQEKLDLYRGMVYTEETLKEAAADKAELNKLKKDVETRRKEVKDRCLEPYAIVEKQAKELTAMIQEPIDEITKQTDAYESRRKDAVKKEITTYYKKAAEAIPENLRVFAFHDMYDPRWENKTATKKSWTTAIDARIEKIKKDIHTIKSWHSEYEEEAMKAYAEELDIVDATNRVMDLKQVAEARRKRDEEEAARKAALEAAKATESEKGPDVPPEAEKPDVAPREAPQPEAPAPSTTAGGSFGASVRANAPQPANIAPDIHYCTLQIIGTKDQINKAYAYAKFIGANVNILETK